MTLLVPWLADRHEREGPTCLIAPDGDTTCGMPATHRVTLLPLPGYDDGAVTFVCDQHEPHLRNHPATATIREVHR